MKIVASVMSLDTLDGAVASGPDLIEIRLDAAAGATPEDVARLPVPVVATLRSREEGGAFARDPAEWYAIIEPWAGVAAFIDIEERFSRYAPAIRERGSAIISSVHLPGMPGEEELAALARRLREYGDIPKIIVTPASRKDVLALLRFTLEGEKPICTGVLGEKYRHARVLLALYGSELVYCHAGVPAAPGQYPVHVMKELLDALA
ncbi:MAG: type I 3-dehydroquinate dehydratase [Methanomicrobiaceae archaeon]|nr:type I 3-dehydroquinate dehydratase [Methanomicrobiaceae archaeon]